MVEHVFAGIGVAFCVSIVAGFLVSVVLTRNGDDLNRHSSSR